MKTSKKNVKLEILKELKNGKLEGGFEALVLIQNLSIFGGVGANNCNGGNCVAGCGKGQNTVPHCGG
jgi:hypothetical protein